MREIYLGISMRKYITKSLFKSVKGMELRIDPRNLAISVVMIISAFVLTARWLQKAGYSEDAILIISAMVLIGCLAWLVLSTELRVRRIEEKLEATRRSIRFDIQSVGENVDRKLTIAKKVAESIDDLRRAAHR